MVRPDLGAGSTDDNSDTNSNTDRVRNNRESNSAGSNDGSIDNGKEASWEETYNWAKDDNANESKSGSSKLIYIIIGTIVIVIVIWLIYMYYRSKRKVDSLILDSVTDPSRCLPAAAVSATSTPITTDTHRHRYSPVLSIGPVPACSSGRLDGGLMSDRSYSNRSYDNSSYNNSPYSGSYGDSSHMRPSPGGTSLLSPKGRLYPALRDGVHTGWWLKPNDR